MRAECELDLIGVGRRDSETPLEHAYRAWKMTGIDRDSLRWLANAATRAVYASESLDEATAHESERIRGDVTDRVRARASWTTRLRAHLDPRTAAALY